MSMMVIYKELEADPRYQAECVLLDLTERIWKMGKPTGIQKCYFRLLEWSANKLIWCRRGKS